MSDPNIPADDKLKDLFTQMLGDMREKGGYFADGLTSDTPTESQDWRDKVESTPVTITPDQRAELDAVAWQSQELWKELRKLEARAYEITQEADKKGYTSDLVLQSDVDVSLVLEYLGITVKDPSP